MVKGLLWKIGNHVSCGTILAAQAITSTIGYFVQLPQAFASSFEKSGNAILQSYVALKAILLGTSITF